MGAAPAQQLEISSARSGRYELFDVFASGGMASVHLGRLQGPVGFARVVAVKRLHPHLATRADVAAMLMDEARVAGRIRHLNVVPTLDVIAEDGELLVVMEYVHGVSLSALLATCSEKQLKVPAPIAIAIVRDMLRGLHAAHEARDEHGRPLEIVHRDVSPQNVIVGTDGVARVVDFGVAKARNRIQESTRDGELKGKLSYMAPEQLKGAAATRRVDIYGAGVVLWEALTGTRLFSGDNEAATWMRVLNENPSPPSGRAAAVSPQIDAIVIKALSKVPDKREPTAQKMADALEAAGPIATPAEIGTWVETVAGNELSRRERIVAAIERTPPPAELSKTNQRPRRRTWAAVVGATVVGGLVIATVASRSASPEALVVTPATADPAPEPPLSANAAPPQPQQQQQPDPQQTLSPAPPLEPEPLVIDMDPATAKPSKARRVSSQTSTRTAKRDCDPPWITDERGRKIYKEHCL